LFRGFAPDSALEDNTLIRRSIRQIVCDTTNSVLTRLRRKAAKASPARFRRRTSRLETMETRAMLSATVAADVNQLPVPYKIYEGIHFQDKLFFVGMKGNDISNQRDLWMHDFASGEFTRLGKDVPSDRFSDSLSAAELTPLGDYFYFRAASHSGSQLWRFDPSADNGKGNIFIVEDFGDPNIDSNPSSLTAFNGKLYFQAYTDQTGTELWEFDPAAFGTPNQTRLVAEVQAGDASSFPSHLTVLDDKLYFQANDGQSGSELWVFDPHGGSGMGSVSLAADIESGPSGSAPQEMISLNGVLYFQATTQYQGKELWQFNPAANDGAGEVSLVADINPGTEGSQPEELTVAGGKIYFRASDRVVGTELFVYDPVGGLRVAWDIDSRAGKSSNPQFLTELGGKLYFQPTGDLIRGTEIWEFDPSTEAGQVTVEFDRSLLEESSHLFAGDGKLFFQAITYPITRRDIYQYDPVQKELITLLDPIRTESSLPGQLTELNGVLFFEARPGPTHTELWQYDPQANNGQGLLSQITGGSFEDQFSVDEITALDGSIYFRMALPREEFNLYRYDPGANTQPQSVLSLPIVPRSPYQYQVTAFDGRLYFVIDDGVHGLEIWEYDPQANSGQPAARRITDIEPGEADSNIELRFSYEGKLYFLAGATTQRLYSFDPAANGGQGEVSLFEDLSDYESLHISEFNGSFYFQHEDDLYQYDPHATTQPNEPRNHGWLLNQDLAPDSFVALGDKIYFASENRNGGGALVWQLDPNSPPGVSWLTRTGINADPFGRGGSILVANRDRLLFAGTNITPGDYYDYYVEMWEFFPEDLGGDGVARRVTSINQEGWASPFELTLIGDNLYFVAKDETYGHELLVLPYNPRPIAQGETFETDEDTELVIDASSLLDNDSDPAGQELSTYVEVPPAHGTLTLNPDGTFRYLPDLNFVGTDRFTYRVTDEGGTSAPAQVEITIHAQPDPANIGGELTGSILEDASSEILGILTVTDPDQGESAFQSVFNAQGTYGVFNLSASGAWAYRLNMGSVHTLPEGGTGTDTFYVTSLDGTAIVPVTITILGSNDAATLGGIISGTTSEDSSETVSGSLTVQDIDQGETFVTPQTSVPGLYGTFDVMASGTWTYHLDKAAVQYLGQGDSVDDVFTVTSLDNTASVDVYVRITGENDAPSTSINSINGFRIEQQIIRIPVASTDIDDNNTQFTHEYRIVRVSDEQVVDSGSYVNVSELVVAVPSAGTYRVEVTTTDTHGGQATAQLEFVVGTQSTAEFSISRDKGAVPGTTSASTETGLHFHEWEEAAGHLWFTIEEGLPNEPFDFAFELTKSDSWLGDPEVLGHLGSSIVWSAEGNVFTGTLADVDLTGYQVGDRVLLATLLLPKDLQNAVGLPMDGQGSYPHATMQTGITLSSAQADALHPFEIETIHNAEFQPIVYDANDDGRIGISDFAQFIRNYGRTTDQDSPDAYRFDYDGNGKIGLSDFALFIRYYGARKSDARVIEMPVFEESEPPAMQQTLLVEESRVELGKVLDAPDMATILPTMLQSDTSAEEGDFFVPDAMVTSSEIDAIGTPWAFPEVDARVVDAILQSGETQPPANSPPWEEEAYWLFADEEWEDSVF